MVPQSGVPRRVFHRVRICRALNHHCRTHQEDAYGVASEDTGDSTCCTETARGEAHHRVGSHASGDLLQRPREEARQALREQAPRSLLVVGEPGVGKSTLRRLVSRDLVAQGWRIFERRAGLLPTLSPEVFGASFPRKADEEGTMSFSGFDRLEIIELGGYTIESLITY